MGNRFATLAPDEIDYDEYINSIDWKIKSRVFIGRRGYKCERCGVTAEEKQLFAHHLHYKTLGCEEDEDIKVVCFACHKIEDLERERRVDNKAYWKGLNTWAANKYGDDWDERRDADRIRDEFDTWIFHKRGQ
jgi:hypothetical protein